MREMTTLLLNDNNNLPLQTSRYDPSIITQTAVILFSGLSNVFKPRVYLEVAYEQSSVTSVFADQQFCMVLTKGRYLHKILISMDPLN
jgi:hypothetical protein